MHRKWDKPITALKGVGAKRAQLYEKLDITTIWELMRYYPRTYIDYSAPKAIAEAIIGESEVISGYVKRKLTPQLVRRGMELYKFIFSDGDADLTVTLFNQKFAFENIVLGKEYILYGKVMGNVFRREMTSPSFIEKDEPAKLQPIYPLTQGITQPILYRNIRSALELFGDKIEEPLPQRILQEYSLCELQYAVESIHFPKDREAYESAKRRLAFEELLSLQLGLVQLKGRNRDLSGSVMKPLGIENYYASLPFELTNAQKRAVTECINDMQKPNPMNRLLQGDVGSGKTAVAAAACYFCHLNGHQSAFMAPTEILCTQHYQTLNAFLEPLGVKCCLLVGSLSQKEKNAIKADIASGEYSVIVGTHALIQQSTQFRRLGLVITDEQHRFGVAHRARLAEKGDNPHSLVMSATPIPRTLALIIYGDLDISVLDELPKGRIPIETYAVDGGKRKRVYAFIRKHIAMGRQAYIVCPAIEESEMELASAVKYADELTKGEFAGVEVGLLHGKLPATQKDSTMGRFKQGEIKLLVSTTVIEVGVDVPNAVVMLIENAERFGLSQLHQLRGRVGRGKDQSYCILMSDNRSETNLQRLKIMMDTNDGFAISEEDLKLRGPGDFFGHKQHGLPKLRIADMSSDMDILRQTQALARQVIEVDADLSLPEHNGLRRLVEDLFEQGEEQGFN